MTVIKKVGIVKVVKMYAQMWHQKKGNVQDHAAGEDKGGHSEGGHHESGQTVFRATQVRAYDDRA